MSILLFALWFILINVLLWKWAKSMLSYEPGTERGFDYNTMYVKGTVRGILGKFESNLSLEEKRKYLKKKNTKF